MLLTQQKYEFVGNFLLHKLSEKYERKNLAVYHDDGLAIFKNVNGPDSIQCNRKVVNLLDVTLNLENLTYHP